jgi:hypothetical protein
MFRAGSPAHITPFRVGDRVRVINPYYTKGMRSNLLKQRPRWSITRYTIGRVEGDIGDMPRYDLEDDDSKTMYTHDMLILANVSEPVPGHSINCSQSVHVPYGEDGHLTTNGNDHITVTWSSNGRVTVM